MDILIPILILLGITIIGFVSRLFELIDIRSRYEFTAEYRSKFSEYTNELFSQEKFNSRLYHELTLKVIEMQSELGNDGVFAYVQDRLKGVQVRDYQLLINFLPETRNIPNESNNSILRKRHTQGILDCDDMFVRHLGNLELAEKTLRRSLLNPFRNFAEGVKSILSFPLMLFMWFGFISIENSRKIKRSGLLNFINIVVTAIGFISGIMAIVLGWNAFGQLIKTILPF